MIEEIQKRPFIRPLFLWVAGILLQVCFPFQQLSLLLLFPVVVAVIISLCLNIKHSSAYETRWVWGILIACIILFLSIQFTFYAEQRMTIPSTSGWLQEKAKEVQFDRVKKMDMLRLSNNEKAVLATITLNYRQLMSREIRSQFSTTGVAHLLSVSGFHVAIVCGLLSFLFSVFPKRLFFNWLRFVAMLVLLWAFAYIAGLSAPAVRAALMLTIFLTGEVLNRYPDRYNTLAAAAFIMLVYNPFYLFEVGFQLSFIAVFFILYLQPRFYRLIELRNPLLAVPWGILTVTVAAQIGTMFLCCYHFGECSTVFLFTNLFLSLLATILIPLALVWMILPTGIPGIEILQWLIESLTKSLMWFVDRFSRIPGATLSLRFDFLTMLFVYSILVLLLLYFRSKRKWMLFTLLSILLVMLCRQLFL